MRFNWSELFSQFGLLKFLKSGDIDNNDSIILNRTTSSGNSSRLKQEQFRLPWKVAKIEIENIATEALLDQSKLQITGVDPIFVNDQIIGENRVIEISNQVYTPPTISLSGNQTFEVGSTNNGSWNAEFVEGRDSITSRSVIPIDGSADLVPGDLTIPFVLSSTNTTKATRGTLNIFDLDCSDGTTPVTTFATMTFYAKVYFFYSTKDGITPGQEITEADIEAGTGTIANNILSVYGGTNVYNIPAGPNVYLYWVGETGTPQVSSITEGPLPVPINTSVPDVPTTNSFGASITYSLVRTENALASATKNLTAA